MIKRLSTLVLVSSLTVVGYASANHHLEPTHHNEPLDLSKLDIVVTDSGVPHNT